eukprot:gene28059-34710_t
MGKGGGGGLAFLNKKSWHTGGFKQIEEVWKREEAKSKEDEKLAELQKQIQEERKAEELQQIAQDFGHTEKVEKLDFMYNTVLAQKKDEDDDVFMLGKPYEAPKEDDKLKKMKYAPGSNFTDDTPKAANEQWARLNNDPMLMIKQQELAQLKHVKNNPVKMAAIKQEVDAMKAKKKAEKAAHKAEKKEKKKEKKLLKEARRDGESGGRSPERTSPFRGRSDYDREDLRSAGRSPGRYHADRESPRRNGGREEGVQHQRHMDDRTAPSHDSACAQKGKSYGLDLSTVPEKVQQQRAERGPLERKERPEATQAYHHKRYVPGKLNEEEK